jgi:hypothetical protein
MKARDLLNLQNALVTETIEQCTAEHMQVVQYLEKELLEIEERLMIFQPDYVKEKRKERENAKSNTNNLRLRI